MLLNPLKPQATDLPILGVVQTPNNNHRSFQENEKEESQNKRKKKKGKKKKKMFYFLEDHPIGVTCDSFFNLE